MKLGPFSSHKTPKRKSYLAHVPIQPHPPQLRLFRRQRSGVNRRYRIHPSPRLHHGWGKRPDLHIANTPFVITFTSQTPKQSRFRVATIPLSSLPYVIESPWYQLSWFPPVPAPRRTQPNSSTPQYPHVPFFLQRQVLLKSSLHHRKSPRVGRLGYTSSRQQNFPAVLAYYHLSCY